MAEGNVEEKISVFDFFADRTKDQSTRFLNSKVLLNETEGDSTHRLNSDSSIERKVLYGVEPTLQEQNATVFSNLVDIAKDTLFSGGQGEDKQSGSTNNIKTLVTTAKEFSETSDVLQESDSKRELSNLLELIKPIASSLDAFAKDLGLNEKVLHPLSFMYYLESEEQVKTPSWKRRKHRFFPSFDVDTIYALHDALYLAELSYVDTLEEVKKGVEAYVAPCSYELIYSTVVGGPSEPAHFICLKNEVEVPTVKVRDGGGWNLFREEVSYTCLDVLIVVRGTKDIGDMVSDLSWDYEDYKGGKAHKGVLEGGLFLARKHVILFQRLLEESKRDKIRLSLIGHSLGAGVAAIAAMEFKELDIVQEVNSIGFGCPALLSKELAESTKEYIVTVVTDADVVPRMSRSTIGTFLLNVMSHEWSDMALLDVDNLVNTIGGSLPFPIADGMKKDVLSWLKNQIDAEEVTVEREKAKAKERPEVVLFPPGKVLHLYRDGVGISASYVPCDFFNEIDCSRTMLDDHYIHSGYNRCFHELVRSHTNKIAFTFQNNVNGLRIEKPEGETK